MNVIFLDVDGVLNGYHSSMERLEKSDNRPNIDLEKIKLLKNVCDKFNCKVVLSSSWKLGRCVYHEETDSFGISTWLKYLLDIFKEYEIDFYGFTPNVERKEKYSYQEMWKENDIRFYLWKHPEVEHFVILDDDMYDLKKLEDYVVKTKNYSDNKEAEGLTIDNINDIEKVLNKTHKYKKSILK